jgi:hypothetical protein
VPTFAEKMLNMAGMYGWDLVACDLIYRFNSGQHGLVHAQPDRALCAKTNILVRRERFAGFRNKPQGKPAPSSGDATAVLDLCNGGIRWGVLQQVLVVHN